MERNQKSLAAVGKSVIFYPLPKTYPLRYSRTSGPALVFSNGPHSKSKFLNKGNIP